MRTDHVQLQRGQVDLDDAVEEPLRIRLDLRIVGEMEEYAREVRRGWGAEGFGVRVGAATGAVVVGEVGAGSRVEYAAFGDTVNVAARLQSAAEPGSVLVDDATHRAVEGLFDWGEPREN